MTSINDNLIQLAETKANIRQAIINKGVEVASTDAFSVYPSKIASISGSSTPDPSDVNYSSDTGRSNIIFSDRILSTITDTYTAGMVLGTSSGISLDKTCSHYEVSICEQPTLGSNHIFNLRINNFIEIFSESNDFQVRNNGTLNLYYWNTSAQQQINIGSVSIPSGMPILQFKFTFGEDDLISITILANNTEIGTKTFTFSGIGSTTFISSPYVLGDISGPLSRYWNGYVFYKGTYVKDLDTNEYVYELVDGRNS